MARRHTPDAPGIARRDLLRHVLGRAQAAGGDRDLVVALGGLELSFVTAYQAMLDRNVLSPLESRIVTAFAGHHLGHAAGLQTRLRTVDRAADPLATDPDLDAELTLLVSGAADRPALMAVTAHIERIAAASATTAVELAVEQATVTLAAEIAPVENQHLLLVCTLLDRPAGECLPDFASTDDQRLDL